PPPLVTVSQEAVVDTYSFTVTAPVVQLRATSTRADRVPLRIVPAYTLAVEPRQAIEIAAKRSEPFDVLLRVHSYATQPGEVRAGLTVPRGWKTGVAVPLKFDATGDRYARLTVTPPLKLAKGNFKISAYVERGTGRGRGEKTEKFTTSLEPLPTLPTQLWTELAGANQRLLDYVSKGGTLVVQYQREFAWDKFQYAPYPALISPPLPPAKEGTPPVVRPLPRITDENSPVKFLKPNDPLLN